MDKSPPSGDRSLLGELLWRLKFQEVFYQYGKSLGGLPSVEDPKKIGGWIEVIQKAFNA